MASALRAQTFLAHSGALKGCSMTEIHVKAFGGLGFLIRGSRLRLGKVETNPCWRVANRQ